MFVGRPSTSSGRTGNVGSNEMRLQQSNMPAVPPDADCRSRSEANSPRSRSEHTPGPRSGRSPATLERVTSELPLFPLRSVLFPEGELRLRVFEPRYLDMVRHCGRQGSGFGICLILDGEEVGAPATPAAFGTEARIADFHAGDDGLLGLVVRGQRRFHVQRTRVRDNGLIVADVDWHDEPPPQRLRPEHGLLGILLQRLVQRFGGAFANAEQRLFDDAVWVGFRLAEMLPFSNAERQQLLQCSDANARLDRIVRRLPQLQD